MTSVERTTDNTRPFPGKVRKGFPQISPHWERILILTSVAILTGLAWSYLVHLGHQMASAGEFDKSMAAIEITTATPWTARDFAVTFAMWAVMMVGMMVPSAAPVLILYQATSDSHTPRHPWLATLLFAFGYLLVWTGFSMVAAF